MLSTLWGASYSFIKVGVQSIPPVTLIAVRTLIAGALLLLVIRWRGVMLPRDASSWQRFFIQACLNSVVPFTLMAWAQQTTDATLATILNSTSPIFAFMLTALVARHEVVTRRRLFGVGAGFVGICLIVGVQALCRLQLWVRNWTTPELPVATVASWPGYSVVQQYRESLGSARRHRLGELRWRNDLAREATGDRRGVCLLLLGRRTPRHGERGLDLPAV